MKIENTTIKPTTGSRISDNPARASRAGSSSPTSKPATDNVEITSLSSQLHALESSLSDVNVVDTARVNAIKQAISEGRFKINPEVVADRLLNSVKELVFNRKA